MKKLSTASPDEISQHLLPSDFTLNDVVVQLKETSSNKSSTPFVLESLEAIAEPLGDSSLKYQYSRAWNRELYIDQLEHLLKNERANILLLGPSGVGKTSILIDAVRRIEKKNKKNQFWLTSANRIIAGMQFLGEWEERFELAIEELADVQGILCIERLIDLITVGSNDPTDSIASFMHSFLQYGELRLVAETNLEELNQFRRKMPGFVEQFQLFDIKPFTHGEAVQVLTKIANQKTQDNNLTIEQNLVVLLEHLFRRFIPYEVFPGRVTNFFNDLVNRTIQSGETALTKKKLRTEFSNLTGLPEIILRDDLPLKYDEVTNFLKSKVVNQDSACDIAAHAITTFKSGLNDPKRPVSNFLFVGPTGVGKTYLAKSLGEYLFSHGKRSNTIIRLDMSEFSGIDAVDRFLMTQEERPSRFIQEIRQNPFSVVLFDEIEKANPELFDLILNLLDEGYLTDLKGGKTWFRSSIIIMTSNINSDKKSVSGFGGKNFNLTNFDLMNYFRPEFINRLDYIVPFQPLNENAILTITKYELNNLLKREGILKRSLRLHFDDNIIQFLAKKGFDPILGARPLQRTIEYYITSLLAKYILTHSKLSHCTLNISLKNDDNIDINVAN